MPWRKRFESHYCCAIIIIIIIGREKVLKIPPIAI